jgi:hypothetical protein
MSSFPLQASRQKATRRSRAGKTIPSRSISVIEFNMNGNGRVSAAGGRGGRTSWVSAENDLSNHKFRIGDSVLYRSGTHGPGAASAVYKITQLLPSESDDCQYRIKSFDEPHERVVKESDLKRDL